MNDENAEMRRSVVCFFRVVFNCTGRWSSLSLSLVVVQLRSIKKKKNSVALVRKRTIPTERPPLVGES
jgi:hypothetical protein